MNAAIEALGWALLHFCWQGLAIAGATASIAGAFRSTTLRYLVSLVGLLAMPVAVATTAVLFLGDTASQTPLTAPAGSTGGWMQWLVAAWAAGAGGCTIRLGIGFALLARLRRRVRWLGPQWQERVRTLAIRVGATVRVRVVEAAEVTVPMVIGWLSPLVVLPLGLATRMPPEQIEAIVLHELAHVRRHDIAFGWLQAFVEALLFFHPAMWWLSRRVRRLREHCCDDVAAKLLGDPIVYARALVDAEAGRTMLGTAAFGGRGVLRERIERILGVPSAAAGGGLRWPAAVAMAGVLAVLGLAWTARPVEEPNPAERSEPAIAIAWLPPAVRSWSPVLEAAAQRHGVDPELLAVMAWVESRGNPRAVSHGGARGLLQVMPSTAAEIARLRGLPEPSAEALHDPELNADFGAWYLARQLELFGRGRSRDEALGLAVAAYNAGTGRVMDHLERGARLPGETRAYRALVTALYAERDAERSPTLDARTPARER